MNFVDTFKNQTKKWGLKIWSPTKKWGLTNLTPLLGGLPFKSFLQFLILWSRHRFLMIIGHCSMIKNSDRIVRFFCEQLNCCKMPLIHKLEISFPFLLSFKMYCISVEVVGCWSSNHFQMSLWNSKWWYAFHHSVCKFWLCRSAYDACQLIEQIFNFGIASVCCFPNNSWIFITSKFDQLRFLQVCEVKEGAKFIELAFHRRKMRDKNDTCIYLYMNSFYCVPSGDHVLNGGPTWPIFFVKSRC